MRRAPPPKEDAGEALEGVVERVVFEGADSGWRVLSMDVPGAGGPVTVVGTLSGIAAGEPVKVTGRWVDHPRFGRQFEAKGFVPVEPTSVKGIERYLGSGLVDGIGPGLAERLVKRFGTETLDVIETRPERLTEVEGIGRVRAGKIQKAWQDARHLKEVMVFLQSYEIGTGTALRIYRRYGARTVQVVKSNPYQLALDVAGIGFRSADKIARALGLDPAAPERIEAGLLFALGQASEEGHVLLPKPALFERGAELLGCPPEVAQAALPRLALKGHVIVDDEDVYLSSLHGRERAVAEGLAKLLKTRLPARPGDPSALVAQYERQAGLTLAPEQRAAIEAAWRAKVLVITGGPGTGKTTIVNGILRLLEPRGVKIALCAPTGRAAKRMSETTGLESKTLHRLLEYAPQDDAFVRNPDNPLEADLVVVDEVSMVDVNLMAHLVEALAPTTQLVLVGDVDQLPSVGPGAVLDDVIASGRVEVCRLTRIFRQAQQSLIVTNAHRINAGEMPTLPPPGDANADFYLIERKSPEDVLRTIETVVTARVPKAFGLDPVKDVQVLTPMHRGPIGAQNLNARLQALLNPEGPAMPRGQQVLRVGDKVMQTKNDYDLGVFNGDVGRVVAVDAQDKTAKVDFDGREVPYDAAALEHLTLAYACSIHKSQGSEYPAVVAPISTQHFVMLHRNLVYTAITRAKRLVVLVGSRRALEVAVRNVRDQRRHTRLAARLADAVVV